MALTVKTIDQRTRIPDDVIHELVSQIAAKFHPKKIFLFGSYGYGKPRPESDLDLLVIMETTLRETHQALIIRQFVNPLFGVDILVYTPSRLQERLKLGDAFLKEITEKGIILYESTDS